MPAASSRRGDPGLDRVPDVRALLELGRRDPLGDLREDVDRRVEEDGAADPLRMARRELEDRGGRRTSARPSRAARGRARRSSRRGRRRASRSPTAAPSPERPWPRRSTAMTWNRSAHRSSASCANRPAWPVTPCTQTTGGASRSPHSDDVQLHAATILPSCEFEVVDGDIALLDVDAVANAANDRLWMGAGVAGALKRAGGAEIEREAMAKGPIPVGTAVATSAGRLPARFVVHGAVMGQDLRTNADLVRRTTSRVPRARGRARLQLPRAARVRHGRRRLPARTSAPGSWSRRHACSRRARSTASCSPSSGTTPTRSSRPSVCSTSAPSARRGGSRPRTRAGRRADRRSPCRARAGVRTSSRRAVTEAA